MEDIEMPMAFDVPRLKRILWLDEMNDIIVLRFHGSLRLRCMTVVGWISER